MRVAMRLKAVIFSVLLGIAAPAAAEPAPIIAPAPAWVQPMELPKPNPALKDRPLQPLLLATQSHYAKDGSSEYYIEVATLIQTPQGLAGMGNLTIPWQPERMDLIVHKVQIVRDGKAIDALAGRTFTVLRRENNLESATLDGILTAVLQPEGLTIGDVVTLAWTMRLKPGTLKFRPENMVSLPDGMPARRAFYREIWEDGVAMRWKAAPLFGKPSVAKTKWGTEVSLDLADAEGPKVPDTAPTRYRLAATLQTTAYDDWGQIGAILAPSYAAAQKLAPTSPLQAEIARIAAASADPRVRAMAALRLVQDKVRYFALAMGEGGYVPSTADQTWARKYGDCKGKTVTLLALLSGLGIEAEPVLVNSLMGDSLGERLPQLSAFNHVLVGAKIGGRTYYLDGTRLGDRSLDDLASSPFRWGLPIRAAGATLEKLPLLPPAQPLTDTMLTYDASKGFEAPVPVSGKVVFRGDLAASIRLALAQTGKDTLKEQFAKIVPEMPGGSELGSWDIATDDEAGTATLTFSGHEQMGWSRASGENAMRYRFDDATIQWNYEMTPPEGPLKDAPVQMGFPTYLASTETIILPRGGKGFTLEGRDFDQTVLGVHIARKLSIEGGRAVARSTFVRLEPELSIKDALGAAKALEAANTDAAWVRSPVGYEASAEEKAAALAVEPKTANEFLERGDRLVQADRQKDALADYDKAAELSPRWSAPWSSRALALLDMKKYDEAKAALDKAASLQSDDASTWQGYGILHIAQDRYAEAVEALTRSLALDPENDFTLYRRAFANERLARFTEASADLSQALKLEPTNSSYLAETARLAAWQGKQPEALAAADQLIAAVPADAWPLTVKAKLLRRFGKAAEAAALFDQAVAASDKAIAALPATDADRRDALATERADILSQAGHPDKAVEALTAQLLVRPADSHLLNSRCWIRGTSNIELPAALADCTEALRGNPKSAPTIDSLALIELRMGRFDAAIADYTRALALSPGQGASLYGRGIAHLRKGEREAGEKDLAAARQVSYDIDATFKAYGITPDAAAVSPGH
jgi:tetratricopeptide (TPR) repeat protein